MRGVYAQKLRTWTALSKYVRRRDGRCVTCDKGSADHAGHLFHNSDKPNKQLGGNQLWYDPQNINGQCFSCNNMHSGRREMYALYLERKYGKGILQKLHKKFITSKKWTLEELKEIELKYVALYQELV